MRREGVLIVNPNAALDVSFVVPSFRPGRLHRASTSLAMAGGKGVNVARALKRLGVECRVLGFSAGSAGRRIEAGLGAEGIEARWVRLAGGESRTCVAVYDASKPEAPPTEINEPGPRVGPADVSALLRAFRELSRGCRFAALCGRLPPGAPAGLYAELIRQARRLGLETALDAGGRALALGLAERPAIVKPNEPEARALGLAVSPAWALRASLDRLAKGGEAFLTLGPLGAAAKLGGGYFRAAAPRASPAFAVGAGDAFLAGVLSSRLAGRDGTRALAFATALSAASARVPGAGLFRRSDLNTMLRKVRVRPL